MDSDAPQHVTGEAFLTRLQDALSATDDLAAAWDRDGAFVSEGLDILRDCGALAAVLPPDFNGLGIGTTPAGARTMLDAFRLIGRHNLSLGRVFEGHVNAVRLVLRYGTSVQAQQAAQDARSGHLFAIWAAEARDTRARLAQDTLQGRKAFASAASQTTRPLLTVDVPGEGECLVLVHVRPEHGRAGKNFDLHGVRSAGTASVDLADLPIDPGLRIGHAGDYMRQPEISLGAWRPLAIQLGGLEALVELIRADLQTRGRAGDAHQLARFGQMLVAQGTARLWVERAAERAEADDAGEDAANFVKLARIAVESACFDAIRLAQRAAGLAAFIKPNPMERIMRDLATYLRQPAMDMVLDEAAAYFLTRPAA